MSKVIVGMSGGVDSAVCAYLLKRSGHDVVGITLKTWISDGGKESRCCEISDAEKVCFVLDIPYYVVNCLDIFKKYVTEPFIRAYIDGKTPNPCTECNYYVKWMGMLKAADDMGAAMIATGHYANIKKLDNGRLTVSCAKFAAKDQTYMLYRLSQEMLSRTLMPLGELSKDEVRRIAEFAHLPVANKPDSQEICFVPDGDYAGYIEDNYDGEIPGPGNFVNEEGKILGPHKGIINYTVGQRKGLGIALGERSFVKEIRVKENEVVLSDNDSLFTDSFECSGLNFMGIEKPAVGAEINCMCKVRYHHTPAGAVVKLTGEDTAEVIFSEPVRAVTPGQAAVFYDEEGNVLGGGTINR